MAKDKKNVVHICSFDKFIKGFVEFNELNCNSFDHEYFIIGYHEKYLLPEFGDFKVMPRAYTEKIGYLCRLFRRMMFADKVIVHGLFDNKLILFLVANYTCLSKVYWVMWGADLYVKEEKCFKEKIVSKLRRVICSRLGGVVTYIRGDYQYAQQRWGVVGRYCDCIMYPSNIYVEPEEERVQSNSDENGSSINILVGHSADPSNNHKCIFDMLADSGVDNMRIYAPLSYGNEMYRDDVVQYGKELFGDDFRPLTKFLPLKDYLALLADIDIAIFDHKRQQAMGNTINLIGLGKTVYMRTNVTQWQLFNELGVAVLDLERFEGQLLTQEQRRKNNQIIKKYFSVENYKNQLNKLYAT